MGGDTSIALQIDKSDEMLPPKLRLWNHGSMCTRPTGRCGSSSIICFRAFIFRAVLIPSRPRLGKNVCQTTVFVRWLVAEITVQRC